MILICVLLFIVSLCQVIFLRYLAGIHRYCVAVDLHLADICNEIKYTKSVIVDLRNDIDGIRDWLEENKT